MSLPYRKLIILTGPFQKFNAFLEGRFSGNFLSFFYAPLNILILPCLLFAASLFYPKFNFLRMDISFLGAPDKNPAGWIIWSTAMLLQGLMIFPAAMHMRRRMAALNPGAGDKGACAFIVSSIGLVLLGLIPQFKGVAFTLFHAFNGLLAMCGMYVGLFLWVVPLCRDRRTNRMLLAVFIFFLNFGPVGFLSTQGYRIFSGGAANYRLYGPCPWFLSFSLWEWILSFGVFASFTTMMYLIPGGHTAASEENHGAPSWIGRFVTRITKVYRVCVMIILGFIAVELGYYVLGRAISPLTAVRVRENPAQVQTIGRFNGRLKIITYNICHGWGGDAKKFNREQKMIIARLDAVAAMLSEEKPDIAVLEEVDFDSLLTGRLNEARYIAEKAGYPYWVEQRNVDAHTFFAFSERSGNVLLSRYPIRKADLVSFPGHRKWETIMGGKSMAVLCDIELANGRKIRLLATHLASFSEEVRVKSAGIIEERRKSSELPFLVVGDLNSAPLGIPNHNVFNGENAMDILLAGGGYITLPLKDSRTSDFTISVGRPSAIVDWILLPPEWRILSRRVLPLTASDHYALAMEVETDKGPVKK